MINNTEYNEKELQVLAITIALQKAHDWLNQAEADNDPDAYRHYTALIEAWASKRDELLA